MGKVLYLLMQSSPLPKQANFVAPSGNKYCTRPGRNSMYTRMTAPGSRGVAHGQAVMAERFSRQDKTFDCILIKPTVSSRITAGSAIWFSLSLRSTAMLETSALKFRKKNSSAWCLSRNGKPTKRIVLFPNVAHTRVAPHSKFSAVKSNMVNI